MSKISDRFIQFFEYQGVSAHEFEKKIGLSNGLIGKIKKTSASFGVEVLEKLLNEYPNINTEWLLRGEGEMLLSDNAKNRNKSLYNKYTNNENKSVDLGSENSGTPMTPQEKKRLEDLEKQVADLIRSNAELTGIVKELFAKLGSPAGGVSSK